ncbi:MAG: hypothetical protein COV59_00305 [Candidatus Magasanikbacteria bacterium CG11_big_fil_rev_8_21_14_0_20_39_34]|uniref:Uncharacterized protein n=1 Tax=Candidatus Magasanikbacteria bacterium CG11_big_fil_rev_8_21_14_0_20_39_34 TaxID=1974653 RepID=A0A2H0N6M9_9BACT|nr:MAG: hypothetical protein COV59_00305 [Candidatus Magasanikbacteria bacterium CG11_big_fil_rev_8_21_14_0_20_39_34]
MPEKRRSYGYIAQEPKNKPPRETKKTTTGAKAKRTPPDFSVHPLSHQPEDSRWKQFFLSALAFPFKVLFWIFKQIFFFWKRRPHMNKDKKKRLRHFIFWTCLYGCVFGFIFLVGFTFWVSRDLPDPDKLTQRKVAESTKIYDRTGEHLLYEIFSDQKRTLVDLEDIPQELVQGLIATEDTTFYEHRGVRPLSILRSMVYGVLGKGKVGGGASTITQQLVKNAILTPEQTLTRKLKEIILSLRLEQKYTKDQILKIYFNEIPYGSTNYGIEAAAQSYFGKHVSDLTLDECATLAGIPKQPTRYLNDLDLLRQRRDFVLLRMFEEGFITVEQKDTAQKQELHLKQRIDNITAPHFVLYVKEQLVQEFGEQMVDTGGLHVLTTLDYKMQKIAEQAVQEESDKLFEDANANNASLLAMDPKNGQVMALVGSRDFWSPEINGQFNVATQGKRQPGSSFKPIIYTAAFEKGYTPQTNLWDVQTNFAVSGKPYMPLNYDLKEHGQVTLQKALQGSLNIPAVKTMYLVGPKESIDFAKKLGYSTFENGDYGLSLVLGGGEVKLVDHVAAYSSFANGGLRTNPVSILRVEDKDGKVLTEWKPKKMERIIEKETAATISNVLSNDGARAYAFGAGGVLTIPDVQVAAKTGTTNNYIDAWTIGYTPNLVSGVWVGNTDNTPMKRGYGGSKVAAPIWNHFMREALKELPTENFPPMPEFKTDKPALRGSENGGVTLKVNKVTGNRATSSTPEHLVVERTYVQGHSILQYVDRADPLGPPPENPNLDPQYDIWEAAIADWVKRKQEEDPTWEIRFEEPPAGFDDEYSLELIPSLQIIHPAVSSTLHSRILDTDIRVSAPRGVKHVGYQLDDQFLGYIPSHPFNLNTVLHGVEPGNHVLTIIVEDDIGNRLEQKVPFILDVPAEPPTLFFEEKTIELSQASFPRVFYLTHNKLEDIKSVEFYKQNLGGTDTTLLKKLDDFSQLFNNRIEFKWDEIPEPGRYKISTIVTIKDGSRLDGDSITISVNGS